MVSQLLLIHNCNSYMIINMDIIIIHNTDSNTIIITISITAIVCLIQIVSLIINVSLSVSLSFISMT